MSRLGKAIIVGLVLCALLLAIGGVRAYSNWENERKAKACLEQEGRHLYDNGQCRDVVGIPVNSA